MSADAVAVLVRAREMVAEGWVQGTGYMSDEEGAIVGRCAGQAIQDAYMGVASGSRSKSVGCMCGCSSGGGSIFNEAMRGFQVTIGEPNIPSWNDVSGRTQEEVLRAFDQTIEAMRNHEKVQKIAITPEVFEATWKAITIPGPEAKVIPVMIDEPIKVGVFAKMKDLVGV